MLTNKTAARTVRFWALVDSSIVLPLAIPPFARGFVELLYRLNGLLGGESIAPAFAGLHLFFVSLAGALIGLWVLARWLRPLPEFALIDAAGRVWVSAIIVYFVAVEGAPMVLLIFIATEMAGAVAQLVAARSWRRHLGI